MNLNTPANIAFGALIGALVAAVTIAVFQTGVARFDLDAFAKLAAVLVAPLTLFLVLGTLMLARETRAMWIQNRAPHVIVTIEPLPTFITYVELVIENVGGGPAFDVQVTFDPELELNNPQRPIKNVSHQTILRPPTLKPKQRIATALGGFFQVTPRRTKVRCTCKDAAGEVHSFDNVIDLDAYAGQTRLGKDPLTQIADELEKLAKEVGNVATGWHRFESTSTMPLTEPPKAPSSALVSADLFKAFLTKTSHSDLPHAYRSFSIAFRLSSSVAPRPCHGG